MKKLLVCFFCVVSCISVNIMSMEELALLPANDKTIHPFFYPLVSASDSRPSIKEVLCYENVSDDKGLYAFACLLPVELQKDIVMKMFDLCDYLVCKEKSIEMAHVSEYKKNVAADLFLHTPFLHAMTLFHNNKESLTQNRWVKQPSLYVLFCKPCKQVEQIVALTRGDDSAVFESDLVVLTPEQKDEIIQLDEETRDIFFTGAQVDIAILPNQRYKYLSFVPGIVSVAGISATAVVTITGCTAEKCILAVPIIVGVIGAPSIVLGGGGVLYLLWRFHKKNLHTETL